MNLINRLKSLYSTNKQSFSSNRTNFILVAILVVILLGGVGIYAKFFTHKLTPALNEVDLPFDPNGPYALLYPRRDGNALVLNITRVSSYDAISYDLAYQSNGIDRGVHGDIKKLNSGDKKSDYSQEILFGTCSQGFTSGGAHCVFDTNVENGTLTLHIQKDELAYRMNIQWHFQKPDVALGKITSGDGHFKYNTDAQMSELALVGYSIVNDMSGVPKLPEGKTVFGKVYSFNVPEAKSFPAGDVSIELADNPPAGANLYKYVDPDGWKSLDTKPASTSGTLTSHTDGAGIFAVLVPSK